MIINLFFNNMDTIEMIQQPRAILCCIQIPTDYILDREGPKLMENFPNVELILQKMKFNDLEICTKTYIDAKDNLLEAASIPLPSYRISIFGLSCNSMSFTLGKEIIDKQFNLVNCKALSTDISRSQLKAISVLKITKISVLMPYIQELAIDNIQQLQDNNLNIIDWKTLNLKTDLETSYVSQETIKNCVLDINNDDCEGIVIGCSAFRACEPGFIDELELLLEKPIITSTQAFLWNMLRMCGINDKIKGYGILFSRF